MIRQAFRKMGNLSEAVSNSTKTNLHLAGDAIETAKNSAKGELRVAAAATANRLESAHTFAHSRLNAAGDNVFKTCLTK